MEVHFITTDIFMIPSMIHGIAHIPITVHIPTTAHTPIMVMAMVLETAGIHGDAHIIPPMVIIAPGLMVMDQAVAGDRISPSEIATNIITATEIPGLQTDREVAEMH